MEELKKFVGSHFVGAVTEGCTLPCSRFECPLFQILVPINSNIRAVIFSLMGG